MFPIYLSWADVTLYDKLNNFSQTDSSYLSEENDLKIKIGLKRKGEKKEKINVDNNNPSQNREQYNRAM